eukprot:GHRR01021297.1.p1 GENE.GHRR01021297.1~~GHRR01021297.1.p1  ORF type:complete len:343 (+),score=85.95 GHRR01021297.1:223-1251(+)
MRVQRSILSPAGPARRPPRCRCAYGAAQQQSAPRRSQQQQQHPRWQQQAETCQQAVSTSRRHTLAATAALAALAALPYVQPAHAESDPDLDRTVTDRIYLDIGVASSAFKPAGERTLGDKTVLPGDAEPIGRIVIGLYGKLAPVTTSNLVAAIQAGGFTGSAFSRVSPGEYIQAGRQGNRRIGDIDPPAGLPANTDLASPRPFSLTHSRPGTVSLSLSENDEDPAIKDKPSYRGLEFLITTGPGPVPRLDGLNPVIGRVESGMDTVSRISRVPSFQPDIRSQQLNRFAKFLGDERADNVRRQYGKPLKAVIILDSGVLAGSQTATAAGAAALTAGGIVAGMP